MWQGQRQPKSGWLWVPAFAGTTAAWFVPKILEHARFPLARERTAGCGSIRTESTTVMRKGASWFNVTALALGLAFLYLPIAILVLYSFNASRLVTVWGGWSTRWYVELWHDEAMLDSALVTLRIGLLSAAAATVLGTLAALALVRFGRFRGRLLFGGMIYAPLVMPEVITGLSLLLLFVATRPRSRRALCSPSRCRSTI